MRFGANKKFLEKMKEKGWTFPQLSERLRARGVNLTASTLFQYADGRRVPNKAEQKAIADTFGCLKGDLF